MNLLNQSTELAAPVVEAVEPEAAPVVEAVEPQAELVVEAVEAEAAPVVEAVEAEAEPDVEAVEPEVKDDLLGEGFKFDKLELPHDIESLQPEFDDISDEEYLDGYVFNDPKNIKKRKYWIKRLLKI